MNKDEARAAARDFERLMKLTERLRESGNRLAHFFCVFYGMWSAFAIRASLGGWDVIQPASDNNLNECCEIEEWRFPTVEAVIRATEKFIRSVTSDNKHGLSEALNEMGVTALCPFQDEQLSRMELVARCVTGRARLIPLVELSLFAVGRKDYGHASKYVMEARAFNPRAWELYNVCVVQGLIALSTGNIREAVQYLDKSVAACEIDENASLSCGARAPNFALAQQLLETGERVEVLNHLVRCKNVWQGFSPQIDKWIRLIECGEIPDLHASAVLKGLNSSSKLRMQWMRACSIEEEPCSATSSDRKSPAAVRAARKKLETEYQHLISASIRKKLEYLDKGLAASPDQPPADSEKPPGDPK
jgi:hypothetical protein